jgi:hypothetical protein
MRVLLIVPDDADPKKIAAEVEEALRNAKTIEELRSRVAVLESILATKEGN